MAKGKLLEYLKKKSPLSGRNFPWEINYDRHQTKGAEAGRENNDAKGERSKLTYISYIGKGIPEDEGKQQRLEARNLTREERMRDLGVPSE